MDGLLAEQRPVLAEVKLTRDWLDAAKATASIARRLRSPVSECMAAANALGEAMAAAGGDPSLSEQTEVLLALVVPLAEHLSTPDDASADARLAERQINAVRPALKSSTEQPLCAALACALLPHWAASLPHGPHWELQLRVVVHNLLAVLTSHGHADGADDATPRADASPSPLVSLAATNALVNVLRHWATAAARPSRQAGAAGELPAFVCAGAATLACELERAAGHSMAAGDGGTLEAGAESRYLHGVSAAVGLCGLLPASPMPAELTARVLRALRACVERALRRRPIVGSAPCRWHPRVGMLPPRPNTRPRRSPRTSGCRHRSTPYVRGSHLYNRCARPGVPAAAVHG